MKRVFVDTHFWVAIARPNDPWKMAAKSAHAQLGSEMQLVTSEEVLTEFLTALRVTPHRQLAVRFYHALLANPTIQILPQSHATFTQGMALYEARPDKEYSLVDCISMQTMREQKLQDVLTHDHHFSQEGFKVLIVPL